MSADCPSDQVDPDFCLIIKLPARPGRITASCSQFVSLFTDTDLLEITVGNRLLLVFRNGAIKVAIKIL